MTKLAKFTTETNTYYLDPLTSFVYDANFNKIQFKFDKNILEPEEPKPSTNKPFIRRLKIQLGMACNYKCKYCVQEDFRIIEKSSKNINCLIDSIKQYEIGNIQLWGGEPLVYWKTLKNLIPSLRKHFPTTSISIISNGSLLNKEKIDFFVKYNIVFLFSHDGPSFTKYRNNIDPLNNSNFVKLMDYFGDQCILNNIQPPVYHVVITPENCDLIQTFNYFCERLKYPFISLEGICTLTSITEKLVTPFTENDINRLIYSYYQLCNEFALKYQNKFYPPFRYIQTAISRLLSGYKVDLTKTRCANADPNILIFDLDGNILACHGARIKSNKTIFTIKSLDDQNKDELYNRQRALCVNCSMLPICKQGCPILSNDNLKYYCKNMKLWSFVIFTVAFKFLTGENITSFDDTAIYETPAI